MTWLRLVALATGISVIAVACGTSGDSGGTGASSDDEGASDAAPIEVDQVASTPREDVPSALRDDRDNPDFPDPLIDPDEIDTLLGPDQIPAIDEPLFLAPDEVDFLQDQEPVIAVELDGDARAYPMQIMTWHEIVNDTIAGVPVTVTYCPLCNTAIAYDRTLDDRVLDFGTSGALFNSALVMYDRQTESLWSHFSHEGLVGVLAGENLDTFPAPIVSWESFRDAHPDGLVLSRETGHARDYGRNPYPGYDDVNQQPFAFRGEVDEGILAAMERVVGMGQNDDPVAVWREHDALIGTGVLDVEVDGEDLMVWHLPGAASGLDSGDLAAGEDVGAVGVFRPTADDQELTFSRDGDEFVDDQTDSRWDIFGRATSGPLEGTQLEPVEHVDTFWFAWSSNVPDTDLIT